MGNAYIYIMANKRNTGVYTGVTSDLVRRVAEHKAGLGSVFVARYSCHKLVYFEAGDDIAAAIRREKQIKDHDRCWKDALVASLNPGWEDLAPDLGVTDEVVAEVLLSRTSHSRGVHDSVIQGDLVADQDGGPEPSGPRMI